MIRIVAASFETVPAPYRFHSDRLRNRRIQDAILIRFAIRTLRLEREFWIEFDAWFRDGRNRLDRLVDHDPPDLPTPESFG